MDYTQFNFRPVLGLTGAGKSLVMSYLEGLDQQVLSVEQLAGVQGVCLADVFCTPRISHDELLDRLTQKLAAFDPDEPVFIEWKSDTVTGYALPLDLVNVIRDSSPINLLFTLDQRVRNLLTAYEPWTYHLDLILTNLSVLGGVGELLTSKLEAAKNKGDIEGFVRTLVKDYFDPLYMHEFLHFSNPTPFDHSLFALELN